jgi:hypothetical protein
MEGLSEATETWPSSLIQGGRDAIEFDCPEMGPPRRATIGGRDCVAKVDLVADRSRYRNSPLCAESCAHRRAFSR